MRMSLCGDALPDVGGSRAAGSRLASSGCARCLASSDADATCCIPLEGGYGLPFNIVGRPPQKRTLPWRWRLDDAVSPGYFEVFKIPVKRGPSFTDRDEGRAPPVVVINETMAKQFLEGWRSPEGSAPDRSTASCASSRTSRHGRSSASSATRATAG